MFNPSGSAPIRDDLKRPPGAAPGRHVRGGPVRAIDHNVSPASGARRWVADPLGSEASRCFLVTLAFGAVGVADPAETRGRRPRPDQNPRPAVSLALYLVLNRIGQLEAAPGEQLDPVVPGRNCGWRKA